MDAKAIREQIEEELRNQKINKAIEKPMAQILYQNQRVKGLRSALLLTEVLKERQAQMELKQKIKTTTEKMDRVLQDMAKANLKEICKEEEKAKQRRRNNEAIAEDLKNQIREKEAAREQERLEREKEAEEMQEFQDFHKWEQRMQAEKQKTLQKNLMHDHMDHIAHKELLKIPQQQQQEAEEERRKLFLSTKQKMLNLHKEREKQFLHEVEMRRESVRNTMIAARQQLTCNDDEKLARAMAELDAKAAERQQKEDERKAAQLKSMIECRQKQQQEKEQKEKAEKQQKDEDEEADIEKFKMLFERQAQQSQKAKDRKKSLQSFLVKQMFENHMRHKQLSQEDQEIVAKNAELSTMEDKQFQKFSHDMISTAAEGQRNLFPLCKATWEGMGGRPGIEVTGVMPDHLAQDPSTVQKRNSETAKEIKKFHEAADIHEGKRRVGFTWQS